MVILDFDGTCTQQWIDCETDLVRLLTSGFLPTWIDTHSDFMLDAFEREVEEKKDNLFAQYDLFNQIYIGCTDDDMLKCGRQIGDIYNREKLWDLEVLDYIQGANRKGAAVIIVTASCDKLVEWIISRAPFKTAAIIGKTFTKTKWLYKSVDQFPRGEDKVTAIKKYFWKIPDIQLACGDSATSDGPMLRLAQHGFLRNKKTGLFEPVTKE